MIKWYKIGEGGALQGLTVKLHHAPRHSLGPETLKVRVGWDTGTEGGKPALGSFCLNTALHTKGVSNCKTFYISF